MKIDDDSNDGNDDNIIEDYNLVELFVVVLSKRGGGSVETVLNIKAQSASSLEMATDMKHLQHGNMKLTAVRMMMMMLVLVMVMMSLKIMRMIFRRY